MKVIQTKLTKHPESTAGKELLDIAYLLAHTDKESFEGALDAWRMRNKSYMDERSLPDADGKTHYLHKRLRSAFLSLKRNTPYLWTWYEHIDLGIPNTNVASMLGQPIPQPIVNYSFNSATSPDDVASIDRFGADPFEVYAQMKRDAEHVRSAADKVNEMIHSPEYQELVKQQKSE